ncbi:hypothetical protein N665_2173s0010, partial [Sinapis alba]
MSFSSNVSFAGSRRSYIYCINLGLVLLQDQHCVCSNHRPLLRSLSSSLSKKAFVLKNLEGKMSKRKRPEPKSSSGGINEDEKNILGLIRSKKGMGATTFEMRSGTKIQPPLITRAITSLKKSNLIKEVPNMNNKGIKHFLAVEFEPCKELTGGDWYIDGALD